MRIYGKTAIASVLTVTLTLTNVAPLRAYSVLSHEAVIDSVWESHLKPLLRTRFPSSTDNELREAHAYAYGGSLTADMGYAPMSSRFFSDLMHYVRSGDIVEALINRSQTLNQYAFALGALAHYVADKTGHPFINRITPLDHPKLATKFGASMTFEDDRAAHQKTEFGLDVLQLARGKYAPESYRDVIGFEIDQDGLDRAFRETYGMKLSDVMRPEIAIGVYRLTVKIILPEMTKIAWDSKRKDIAKLAPETRDDLSLYSPSNQEYEEQWGHEYQKPGIRQRILSFFFKIMPPVGFFNTMHFDIVPESGEKLFQQSFDATVAEYCRQLDAHRRGQLHLSNDNLDTGEPAHPGAYAMADKAYATLLQQLDKKHFNGVPEQTRADILSFFANTVARDHASLAIK